MIRIFIASRCRRRGSTASREPRRTARRCAESGRGAFRRAERAGDRRRRTPASGPSADSCSWPRRRDRHRSGRSACRPIAHGSPNVGQDILQPCTTVCWRRRPDEPCPCDRGPTAPVGPSRDAQGLGRPERDELPDVAEDVHDRPHTVCGDPGDELRRQTSAPRRAISSVTACSRTAAAAARDRAQAWPDAPRGTGAAPPESDDRRRRTAPTRRSRRASPVFQLGTTKMSRGCHSTTKSCPIRVRPRPSTATKTVASVERYGAVRKPFGQQAG